MADEEQIKAEARLWALEALTTLFFAAQHKATGDAEDSLKIFSRMVHEKAARQTFPTLDPAHSDNLSAEFEAAMARLLRMQREWLGLPPPEAQ